MKYIKKFEENEESLIYSRKSLGKLPDLQEGLINLTCKYNVLTDLPKLPSTLEDLDCMGNLL